MQIAPEIAFHNLPKSDWAEQEIRARIAKLEKIYDRLVTVRVRVDQRATNSHGTIPPVVHIEMGIPGRNDLVVSHEPDHLQQKFQSPDLHNAINEAFRIAEDQLAELKQQMKGRPKEAHHPYDRHLVGQVAERTPGEDFGFLMTNDGALLHFHRDSVVVGDFEKLSRGDEVMYVETMGDLGPTATKVRVKEPG